MSHGPVGTRGAGYGLDAELARKQAAKYDTKTEVQVKDWITAVTGEAFTESFGDSLKDGRMLCMLINKIQAGSVRKIETSKMPFKQMENISNFLKACRTLSLPEHDLFETVDLFEQKDLGVVVNCLMALGRLARSVPGFAGPFIGGGSAAHAAPEGTVHAPAAAAVSAPLAAAPRAPQVAKLAPPAAAKPVPPPPAARPTPAAAPPVTVFSAPSAATTAAPAPVVESAGRTNTNKGPVYGLDAELRKKMQLQYDPVREAEAVAWITAVTQRVKPAGEDLGAWLHDGTVLCELVNAIRPGSIKKINNSTMPFKQMENITGFLRCCRSSLSVPEADLFETVDLFEEKNMNFVVRCIFSLGRAVQTLKPPYAGPVLSEVRR